MALVDFSERGDVAVVTMNRPPANALSPELLRELLAALERLRATPPSAVVLTGTAKFFSAGLDLRIVPALSEEELTQMARDVNGVAAGWYTLPRPLVAAVNGHAVAGGFVIALCGDFRIGPTSGRFGLTEVKAGVPYPSAAMSVVRAELTPAVARRLVLRGELFDAAAMRDFGVFDEVVADGDVLERAIELAGELAALPRATFTTVKAQLRHGALERERGAFGGATSARAATAEALDAARRLLDER
jgi:enoyl-CoA hydratase